MSTTMNNSPPRASEWQTQELPVFQKPKGRIGFSLRSSHSRKSSGLEVKIPLQETHKEKEARRLHTKADPSMAMTEEQPSVVASGLQTTLAPIRAIQHRDSYGNPIVEPDRSNPTRSRWERPLETIRSFEAAVDGSYSRRSYIRNEIRNDVNASRKSLYSSDSAVDGKAQYRLSGHYGTSPPPSNGYAFSENIGPSNTYHPSRNRYTRPEFFNGHSIYTVPDVQESHETVNSALPSGSSAELNYSTDPSSEDSPIDPIGFIQPKDIGENYGFKGGCNDNAQHQSMTTSQDNKTPRQFNNISQPFPELLMKQAPRISTKLESSHDSSVNLSSGTRTSSRASSIKLKSWIGKRFSRVS